MFSDHSKFSLPWGRFEMKNGIPSIKIVTHLRQQLTVKTKQFIRYYFKCNWTNFHLGNYTKTRCIIRNVKVLINTTSQKPTQSVLEEITCNLAASFCASSSANLSPAGTASKPLKLYITSWLQVLPNMNNPRCVAWPFFHFTGHVSLQLQYTDGPLI